MENKKYHPEEYWTKVGQRIEERDNGKNVIAGDDEPYYRYKRKRFLDLLKKVDFKGKDVMELGCGPGGNLLEVHALGPKRLAGVDISSQMVKLAKSKVPNGVEIHKIDGTKLPFSDNEFDIAFTATVLQHNTDDEMMKTILKEICRVTGDKVYLFERVESSIKGDDLCLGRPVEYYEGIVNDLGFELTSEEFINIRSSYYVSGAIRKGLNPSTREEGEPLNGISTFLQNATLPITKVLDKVFTSKKDICRMEFTKKK